MKEDDKNAMKRNKVKDIVHKIMGQDKKKNLNRKMYLIQKKRMVRFILNFHLMHI